MYALNRKVQIRCNKDEVNYWSWCTFTGSVFDQPCNPGKSLKAGTTITVS